MIEERGIACCGLACCVCSRNETCVGCRNEGCSGKDWCVNLKCCREKGLNGCWECAEFPCEGSMLDKLKIRTFATFVRDHGEAELMRFLARNERNGMVYHYPDQIVGDYDAATTEAELLRLICEGRT